MRSGSFRILDHPADVGFEAFGATREEAFANAGLALTHLRVDLSSIELRSSLHLIAHASDLAGLLVNWLSEILYYQDAEGWLPGRFEIENLSETSVAAVAKGESFNPARHSLKTLVKAVTYHQLVFERNGNGWRAQVFVDV